MKLSASVMAHPDRADQVARLRSELDRPVPVHWDPEGPPSGNGDRVWRQARSAWQMAAPDSTWHLLLQDDAKVCPDLLAGLEQALDTVPPGAIVSAYLGTGRAVSHRWRALGEAAEQAGVTWALSNKLMWGVAICLPTALIPAMIEYADRRAGAPDDMRVAGWAERAGMAVAYTWPSLVDHLPVPSLTKHRAVERVAMKWSDRSALDIEWSTNHVRDSMLARRNPLRSGPSRVRSVREAETRGR